MERKNAIILINSIFPNETLDQSFQELLINLIKPNLVKLSLYETNPDILDKYRLYDEDISEITYLMNDMLQNPIKNKDKLKKFINEFYIKCKICKNAYPITIMKDNEYNCCHECFSSSQREFNSNIVRDNFKEQESFDLFMETHKDKLSNFTIYQIRDIYRKLYFDL